MKLHSQVSRKYKGKKYYKHWVVIPSNVIEKLDWEPGEELECEIEGDKLVIEKD